MDGGRTDYKILFFTKEINATFKNSKQCYASLKQTRSMSSKKISSIFWIQKESRDGWVQEMNITFMIRSNRKESKAGGSNRLLWSS